jgi:hypothetical protein
MGSLFAPDDPVEALDRLWDMGVTVTLDRPRGQLHVRPRPLPDSHANLSGRTVRYSMPSCTAYTPTTFGLAATSAAPG